MSDEPKKIAGQLLDMLMDGDSASAAAKTKEMPADQQVEVLNELCGFLENHFANLSEFDKYRLGPGYQHVMGLLGRIPTA
jgi:hypothetical protein